jgi:hypothetical protein
MNNAHNHDTMYKECQNSYSFQQQICCSSEHLLQYNCCNCWKQSSQLGQNYLKQESMHKNHINDGNGLRFVLHICKENI